MEAWVCCFYFREKLELAEDIKAKQELIQQRKVEMEGFQENVDAATRQRESLEKEKEEARTLLEQLNNEVRGWNCNTTWQTEKLGGKIYWG